jgi:murein DD-endopeptidase MepM/ murein hydrolase activator NlpD
VPDETATYRSLPEGWIDIRLNTNDVVQGSTLVIYAQNILNGTPAGRFGDQPLNFGSHGDGYVAFVGVEAIAEPGNYLLELTGGDERNLWQPVRAQIPVTTASYPTQTIQVDESLSPLLDPAVRSTEDELLHTMFAVFEDQRRWDGLFQVPVTTTVVSAGYGGLRSYNSGPAEIYHTGTDFAAALGDVVSAPAAGVVVFSGQTQLRGNIVIINHGLGVMSGLYHLEESFVEAGQEVSAGQQIGRVGSTGLSSGPHLHWDMRIMGVPVDPLPWTQQAFP